MRPTSVTVGSQTSSAWIPVDYRQTNFNLGISVVSSGTNTWKVEVTMDDPYTTTPTAITAPSPLDTGSGGTNEIGNITIPCRAVRLTVSAWTSGAATMTVVQGGS
jgi:uncharacterized protein YgiM (DUF1202 family)